MKTSSAEQIQHHYHNIMKCMCLVVYYIKDRHSYEYNLGRSKKLRKKFQLVFGAELYQLSYQGDFVGYILADAEDKQVNVYENYHIRSNSLNL